MNLVNHLATRAVRHPERLALVDASTELSYGNLYKKVCAASQRLRDDGLKVGDTILILQPVGCSLYISLLGALHAGLVVVLVDPSAGKEAIGNCLRLQPPCAFLGIGRAHLLRLLIPELRKVKHRYHASGWAPGSKKWVTHAGDLIDSEDMVAGDPALITFTSGSTGMPKAACRTHGFLLSQHKALAESLHYCEGEVDLVTLPVFALANLASGLTSVIANTDLRYPVEANSAAIYRQCADYGVTRCAASPAFFNKLLQDEMLPEFVTIYTGGAPVFPSFLDRLHSLRPEMSVVTVFGSTEAEPIAHIPWSEVTDDDRKMMAEGKGLLVGEPVDAISLKVVRDQTYSTSGDSFDSESLPLGEVGEILVTGDHVLKGYLNGLGDEESKIKIDGEVWHRTGDAAWLDRGGRLWLVGRCVAAIKRSDMQVLYPFGVECAAMDYAGVQRCAVMEYQDEIYLFYQGDLTQSEVNQLCARVMKLGVQQIQGVANIPVDKRHNAKVDYPAMRSMLG